VRIREAGSRNAADIDAADPTASDRGRYRALGLLVLQRGSLAVRGLEVAVALHRSLREFIRDNRLAPRRRRNAVVVGAESDGEFVVSVAREIHAAFSDREKNKTPAA
jgi:hypothetical protein